VSSHLNQGKKYKATFFVLHTKDFQQKNTTTINTPKDYF